MNLFVLRSPEDLLKKAGLGWPQIGRNTSDLTGDVVTQKLARPEELTFEPTSPIIPLTTPATLQAFSRHVRGLAQCSNGGFVFSGCRS